MTIKFYGPMKLLGFVTELSGENGETFSVSAKVDDFMAQVLVFLIFAAFLAAFTARFFRRLKGKEGICIVGKTTSIILFTYAILQAVGIGPYFELYPQGGGFIDMSTLEHLLQGAYTAFLGVMVLFGGKCGEMLGKYVDKLKNTKQQ